MVGPQEPGTAVETAPACSAALYEGYIYELREQGRLLGIATGVWDPNDSESLLLQHIVVWPGAPHGTLLRLLHAAERAAWRSLRPKRLYLDIEHQHPNAKRLRRLAERFGYRAYCRTNSTTWFIKEAHT